MLLLCCCWCQDADNCACVNEEVTAGDVTDDVKELLFGYAGHPSNQVLHTGWAAGVTGIASGSTKGMVEPALTVTDWQRVVLLSGGGPVQWMLCQHPSGA